MITDKDYAKAIRRADRLNEIEQFGKLISTRPSHIHRSKKAYSRKGYRVDY